MFPECASFWGSHCSNINLYICSHTIISLEEIIIPWLHHNGFQGWNSNYSCAHCIHHDLHTHTHTKFIWNNKYLQIVLEIGRYVNRINKYIRIQMMIYIYSLVWYFYPWRRKWLLTPVFLPREFHGQRSLVRYSPWVRKQSDRTECLTLSLSFLHSIFKQL